ncbi:hypothetical protein Pmar_PMAR006157 [Perkinsus marinus ATCC 50983]|uniref:Uncharacterized protein n=1 Tax=Perkinsus marinus (strain ATCC 50983 / TXsc) TaxID=423536 RepID=C5LAD0_PERM5|nr:hypothetical protein Pmar_PMAR006157 [Perkinsus marinus ATCC 50983]EER06386.1 hypothetical protein Pmar_PMAR006157 [Perkinsus marinus ATCC 50983]|eukprot:XP_002774570.1 hypothetical protein Pmar_PMAR006157 [Perkinsus marinus ATCC 50983]
MPDSPFAMSDSLAKAMVEADAPTKHVRCLMDDISVGSDDARHLTALRRDITQRLSHRMFETNDKKEVSNLPDQIPSDPQPCLGVQWHPKCDSLSLKSDLRHKASTVTTVKLLKRYGNGFYDPLGWHLELSMQLRLLCRQARSNADPHTGHLRAEDTQALVAWENQLKAFDLRVPRLLRRPDSSDTAGAALLYTLHGQLSLSLGYVKLTPTTGANRYRSVFFQPIDNVVRTVSEPVHDSDTPLPGPPESHQVSDESIPDKAPSVETTVSPQVEADSSKALASAQDDAHVNDTAPSALPSKAFTSTTGSSADDTVIHEPSSTSSRPRTKRTTVPRRTGDPHPEVKNFAYINSSGRGGLQYGRVISVDQGLYRLQLADRSADGNSLRLRSDMASSPTAYLLRVQGDSDDFPDNKTDFRLTRASVRFLDNLKMTKR